MEYGDKFCGDQYAITSDYSSKMHGSLLLRNLSNKIGIAQNGILVTPTLSSPGHEGIYRLHVYSSNPVETKRIPSKRSITLSGEWKHNHAGGCHLNEDWKRNPKYTFHLLKKNTENDDEPDEARVRITLSRPTKEWAKI